MRKISKKPALTITTTSGTFNLKSSQVSTPDEIDRLDIFCRRIQQYAMTEYTQFRKARAEAAGSGAPSPSKG